MRKQQIATVPNSTTTNVYPVIQINNQSNIDTNENGDEDQFNYPLISPQILTENHEIFNTKGIAFAKHFLTYNSWILTNKCITSNMRHNTTLKNNVLKHLVNQNFLCEIKGGLKSQNVRSAAIDIWVKCMPASNNDFTTIQQWDSELSSYGVSWDRYASTLSNINLMEDLYMTDELNQFILENYSTISIFIDVSYFVKTVKNIVKLNFICLFYYRMMCYLHLFHQM